MKFSDILLGAGPRLCYRTGMTTYTEELRAGRLVGRGWNAAGFVDPPQVLFDGGAEPIPASFRLEIDGQDLSSGWECESVRAEGDSAVIRLRHTVRPVTVEVHTVLDGTPVLRRWLRITNTGTAPAALATVSPWSGLLWHRANHEAAGAAADPADLEVGAMADGRWGHEGAFGWTPLTEAGVRIAGRYRRPPHRHPLFVLRSVTTGEHFIGQLAWSGGYLFTFDPSAASGVRHVSFAAGPDAPAPQRVLAPGETVETPALHLGLVLGDLDEAVNAMHAHVRTSVLLRDPARFGLVESGIGPEQELTVESVLHEIDEAAELGAEVFFLDASWYAPPGADWFSTVGDWAVGSRFPDGLEVFRSRVRERGMRWGLWMEPERFGAASRNGIVHSDLVGRRYDATSAGGHLDLARPEAAAWLESAVARVIEEHDLDFFRLDYNPGWLGPGFHNAVGGYTENHYWRYYQALYVIFDRLRARFPGVVFENCASGGARTDLGMVARFEHTWVTDWQLAPRSFAITSGMTIALPPEYVDRHAGAGMNDHLRGDLDFQLHLIVFGRPTIGWLHPVGSARNPAQLAKIQQVVALYKDFVRPFQPEARVYHHSASAAEQQADGWGVLELAGAGRDRAVVGLFRLGNQGRDTYRVRPRGLDPARRYRLQFLSAGTTVEVAGSDLLLQGVPVRRAAALTSELLVLEAIA